MSLSVSVSVSLCYGRNVEFPLLRLFSKTIRVAFAFGAGVEGRGTGLVWRGTGYGEK